MKCFIRENSFLAKLAAKKLKSKRMAIVIGHTIHLHNASMEDLLSNRKWLRHELEHVKQFEKYGLMRFLTLYLLESIKRGYHHNRFEVEARNAEKDERILSDIQFTRL